MPTMPIRQVPIFLALLAAAFASANLAHAQQALPDSEKALARSIFKELIEINTTQSVGSTRKADEAMAARLRAAGYADGDIAIVGPDGERKNLVVRLRGSGSGMKPVLLLAHTDVVEARKEDWSADPFVFREDSGAFYGRGSNDNKAGAAVLVANMIRWKREGFVPDRDVIMLLTTDEETDAVAGAQWILKNRRDLIDAEFCLNTDAGDGELGKDGKPSQFFVSAAEKVYQDFTLETRNKGGHSSVPRPDNAIYTLANGLARLAKYKFPAQVNEVTRALFRNAASAAKPQIAADLRTVASQGTAAAGAVHRLSMDPVLNSTLRTTCVATMLQGGHATNALPQVATANVNCRMFPGSSVADVTRALQKAVADTSIKVRPVAPEAIASPASPLRPDLMSTVTRLVAQQFPGATVIPGMDTGASDGLFFRNAGIPTYGVSALLMDPGDSRAHGRDERVPIDAFYNSAQFWYLMVKALASRNPSA
jgi:acetylornithine deacetylase/succinyl-diaminopimelate desuccinylase-like protein